MMIITKEINGNTLVLCPEGRLDTMTCMQLEKEINESLVSEINTLILNFEKLVYISSAGLRVVLSARKKIGKMNGTMIVKNVNETIMEVLEISGFVDILTIE
jgi:anti-sigma B factor antagonist